MGTLFFLFLGLHLLGVAIAYGSTLLLPLLHPAPSGPGGWLGLDFLVKRLSLPAALSMPVTGAGMVVVAGINPTSQLWLGISIVLYLLTLVYLVFRQRPRVLRLLRGERSGELLAQLRQASIGVAAVILVIAAMMIFKPGR